MTCKHNNVSIFNNGSLHTWQCADCGGKAQKPYIHSPPFDVWPQESDIHYAEPKVFQFQPIRKTAYMVTPFNETIREIAGYFFDDDIDCNQCAKAILSAFDEFAKLKPSIPVIDEGVDAFVLNIEKAGGTKEMAMIAAFRAMLAQAVKEMKEWTPNTTQK